MIINNNIYNYSLIICLLVSFIDSVHIHSTYYKCRVIFKDASIIIVIDEFHFICLTKYLLLIVNGLIKRETLI